MAPGRGWVSALCANLDKSRDCALGKRFPDRRADFRVSALYALDAFGKSDDVRAKLIEGLRLFPRGKISTLGAVLVNDVEPRRRRPAIAMLAAGLVPIRLDFVNHQHMRAIRCGAVIEADVGEDVGFVPVR